MSLPRLMRRVLVQDPSFSFTAILLLAVGIGANTSVFSILNDVFFRPLSGVEDPEGLVTLLTLHPNGETSGFSFRSFEEYRARARSFTDLVAGRGAGVWWQEGNAQRRLDARFVTEGYFSVIGVRMGMGRDFSPEETVTPDTHPVAILSHDLWRSAFQSDPGILGQRIRLNEVWFTVVGVAPSSFRGVQVGEAPSLWIPLMMEGVARPQFPGLDNGIWRVFEVLGRLKPGVSPEAAQAELTALSSRIERRTGAGNQGPRVLLRPDVRRPDPGFASSALVFLAPFLGVALVLVIVCANLAGLLLARNLLRRRDFAVQMAIGASRRALVGRMIGDCVFLAVIGSGLGLILSRWITSWIRAGGVSGLDLSSDFRVGVFTALTALLAGVGIGLIPALQATGRDLVTDLKDKTSPPNRSRTHGILVSAQIALSLVLLTGAGLLVQSLRDAIRQEVGFETDPLLLVACDLRAVGYSESRAREYLETLTERVRGLPGVQVVARANEAPVDRGAFSDGGTIILEGGSAADTQRVARTRITPEYFNALDLDLLAGREFTVHDDSASSLVAIVNEPMARRLWPGTNPLGQRFRFSFILWRSDPVTVVGVSPGVRTFSREDQPRAELFLPLAQHFEASQWLLIRVGEGAGDLAPVIRDEIRRLDPDLPPPRVESVAQRRARLYEEDRFLAEMTGAFGILGLTLSALGLLGILSLDVSRRRREMGIRMALGARRAQVIMIVLGRALFFVLPGIGVGLLGSLALTRLMGGALFGVSGWNPAFFAAAAGLLLAVAAGASVAPAVRAASGDPSEPLRSE